MSLYPSLEDMAVDKMAQAQVANSRPPAVAAPIPTAPVVGPATAYPSLYPSLHDLGLELPPEMVQEHMQAVAQYQPQSHAVVRPGPSPSQQMVAPVTGRGEVGLVRSEIKQGIREIILCKDTKGKIGLAVKSINKGVFVAFVYRDSPAAVAGLRFGDQILQIDGHAVAGFSTDKATSLLKKAAPERISLAIRDRPFERTITMQKDSMNHTGFVFKKGKIEQIVKDSSAARNGILIEHHLVEVNGQNVVGLEDKQTQQIFATAPRSVTVTVMPSFVFEHIVRNIGGLKKYMDHSIPEV